MERLPEAIMREGGETPGSNYEGGNSVLLLLRIKKSEGGETPGSN
jgi:hypothetical protein